MSTPTNAYRVFTDAKGDKQLHFIDATGSVVQLVPDRKTRRLADGYYTRDLKPIGKAKLFKRANRRAGADILELKART